MDLSQQVVGIIGVGKIGSCVCRGYLSSTCARSFESKPKRILLSQRSKDKVDLLLAEHPTDVEMVADLQELVQRADIIFIGLLPSVAREILPTLPFNDEKHFVISMMAAVDMDEVIKLTRLNPNNVVRTVPLPSVQRRSGPILLHPKNEKAEGILRLIGTPVGCANEAEMKPMVSMTGHISSFYELMRVTQDWCIKEGVAPDAARLYVSSFYSSLAQATQLTNDSLEHMCEEAITPGGLNEQTMKYMRATDHYRIQESSLQQILNRLLGK
jgi:pyrroline-5-carboxylate reductase